MLSFVVRVLCVSALVPALAVSAGCGDDGASTATAAGGVSKPKQIRLSRPAPGLLVRAKDTADGRMAGSLTVSGRAGAREVMYLRVSCETPPCETYVFSDGAGRFSRKVPVKARRAWKTLTLTVGYGNEGTDRPVSVRIRLKRVRAAAPVTTPAAPPLPDASSGGTAAPTPAVPVTGSPRVLFSIGDSLAVGTAGPLEALLPGWEIHTDARIGRALAEGMRILDRVTLPPGDRGQRAIFIVSLFTNDSPQSVDALEAAVRDSVARLGPHGCAIWSTVRRPPLHGVSYAAANARLTALASDPSLSGRLLVIPWAETIAEHPDWLGKDRVHPIPVGYQARAQLVAQAVQACIA